MLACGWRFASTPVAQIGIILAEFAVLGTDVNSYQADSGLYLRNRIHGHFGVIGDFGDRGPIGSRKPKRKGNPLSSRCCCHGGWARAVGENCGGLLTSAEISTAGLELGQFRRATTFQANSTR